MKPGPGCLIILLQNHDMFVFVPISPEIVIALPRGAVSHSDFCQHDSNVDFSSARKSADCFACCICHCMAMFRRNMKQTVIILNHSLALPVVPQTTSFSFAWSKSSFI